MIVSVIDNTRALDTVEEIMWLLSVSSRHGPPLGRLELLGRGETGHLTHPAAAAAATRQWQQGQSETAREQQQSLLHAVRQQQQVQPVSKQGVVLSLPRRALQGWLLREGRAWRKSGGTDDGGGGGDAGGLWTPSWVEDGIDVVPPELPGFGMVRENGVDRVSGDSGSGDTQFESTVASSPTAREGL